MEFKIGDEVKDICVGNAIIVEGIKPDHFRMDWKHCKTISNDIRKDDKYWNGLQLIKRGGAMSIRSRIEALNNGWDKEADDILQEILDGKDSKNCMYVISIHAENLKSGTQQIRITDYYERDMAYATFPYCKTQCTKMSAFKDALLWLLEKSGLESHKPGEEIKIESEGKTYKVKILEQVN